MTVKSYAQTGALIVGGSSGIGLETALRLASRGVPRLVLAGRDRATLDRALVKVRDVSSARVDGVSFDAADPEAAAAGIAEADRLLDGVDVLVSSVASSASPELLHDIEPGDIGAIVGGLLFPPLLLTRLVLPSMSARHGGAVVLIASDAAKVATPGESVIGAAMAGIVSFARTAALEAKRHGIRINAVTPSLVTGTPTADRLTSSGFSARLLASAAKQASLGVTETIDVAELVAFLAGPQARRITGQAISVNSGISAA